MTGYGVDILEVLNNISGFHEYELSEGGRFIFVSDSLCAMTGYEKRGLLDMEDGCIGIVHPDDRDVYTDFLRRLAGGEKSGVLQYRIVKKDGGIICVKDMASVKRTEDGGRVGCSTLADVTDIVEAVNGSEDKQVCQNQMKKKDGNENLSFLNDTIPCGFIKYTCEKQPRITYVNRRLLELLRFPEEKADGIDMEMYRNNLFLLIPMEDRHRFALYLNRVYSAGAPVAGEMTVLRFDGTRAHFFGWVTKAVNEDGDEEFQSVCMDVTESHLANKNGEMKRYIKALSEVYDKIFEYNFDAGTVKCLCSNRSPMFTMLENITMQLEEATEKWIADTVVSEDVDRVHSFFVDFCQHRLDMNGDKPAVITYRAKSSDGLTRKYSGIFLKLDEHVSLYCCRRLAGSDEAELLRNENASLREHMQELVRQFTDGVAAFKVTADGSVVPLYSSDNVCEFFGYTREEWLSLMQKGTPLESFVARSDTDYEVFEKLLRDGEAEFTYYDLKSGMDRRIRAVCSQKELDGTASRYVMLYTADDDKRSGENVQPENVSPRVSIRTFGYFDVFVGGRPIAFRNKKSKELFALLVDRRGGYVTSEEAIGFLWEDEPASPVTFARYRKVALRLKNLLEEYGIADIVEAVDGKRRIVCEKVQCDLYDYLSGREEYAQLFKGSYLSNYSWAETTLGELCC